MDTTQPKKNSTVVVVDVLESRSNERVGLLTGCSSSSSSSSRAGAPTTESSRLPHIGDILSGYTKNNKNNNHSQLAAASSSSSSFQNYCLCIGGTCICCIGLIYFSIFIFVCILLSEANNPGVHLHCGDFWNFMLVAILFPMLLPFLFCLVRPCISISWLHFSGASAVIMAIASFCTAYHAGSEPSCIAALRLSSPPNPLLLYLDYVNGGLFSLVAISAISKQAHIMMSINRGCSAPICHQ